VSSPDTRANPDNPANPAGRLSHSQSLIWNGQKLSPDVPLYNMAIAVSIFGEIDVDAFRRAFQTVLSACDALRTVFREVDGHPSRVVIENMAYAVPFHDLTAEPDAQDAAQQLMTMHSRRNFNLGDSLFESLLLKTAPDRFIWYFNQHHLVTDAWSTEVFYRHFATAYQEASKGLEPAVPKVPAYQRLVDFQEGERGRAMSSEAARYWSAQVNTADVPPRLYGRPRRHDSTATTRLVQRLGKSMQRTETALSGQPGSQPPHQRTQSDDGHFHRDVPFPDRNRRQRDLLHVDS
jgi:hypothetical protein